MVAILGCGRKPAFPFATDLTRQTNLDKLVWCLHDPGGVPFETLTDGDPAFCVGQTADGKAILSAKWVDLCSVLDMVPKACRP